MAVSTQHPDYKRISEAWRKCRDVYAGTDAMRSATTDYLPMLTDEAQDAYRARLNRTVLYNAFYRTVSGFTGMLFRVPPVLDAPEYTKSLTEDITLTGVPLNVLAQEIADECQIVGRVGLYCNYPITDTDTMTQADAIAYNLRPSLSIIKAEQIINWKQRRVNNKYVLSMAVIKEEFLIPENEFKDKCVTRYRVLDLDENDVYRVRIMTEDDKGNDVLVEGPFYPMMNGATMSFIPLVIIGPDNVDADVDEPILVDLADLNIAHYQAYADLSNGCHWSGIPTPVFIGMELPQDGKMNVGMGRGIIIPNPAGKAMMLEVGTSGFSALDSQLNRLEIGMVAIGSRLLESHRVQAESAQTATIYRAGEQSILSAMSIAISTGITAALKIFAQWAGNNASEVRFTLNKEFFKEQVTPEMLNALVSAWQNGGISAEARFEYLKTHEFIPPHISFEDEQARIASGISQLIANPENSVAKPITETESESETDGEKDTEEESKENEVTNALLTELIQLMRGQQNQPIDMQPIADAIAAMPAPVVNVAAPNAPTINVAPPSITVEGSTITMPEQHAPIVNIAPAAITVESPTVNVSQPSINVEAPTINMPEQQAPVVNVAPAAVTVEGATINMPDQPITVNMPEQKPANVTVNNMQSEGKKAITVERDASGKIIGATAE